MKYRQLKEVLDNMDEDRLMDDVTIYLAISDEFVPVLSAEVTTKEECDVLDEGHTILLIEA